MISTLIFFKAKKKALPLYICFNLAYFKNKIKKKSSLLLRLSTKINNID